MIALTRKLWIFTVLFAALLMAGCVSLAGDVTPPPNYVRPTDAAPAQAQAVSQTVFPLVPPDPAQGAQTFGQKCAPCHGDTGKGDGPQAANLPNPPAPIGQPDFAHMARPSDWFNIVTNGNLQKYMPGFESLNERQRWDVVAYAMTLSISQEELAQGKPLYEANCASCHGSAGKGDGPQAASLSTKPTSWVDQSKLVSLSADDIVAVMVNGQGDMPGYKGKLDETQSYAVAAYIRTLSFSGSMAPAVAQAAQTIDATQSANGTPAADGTPSTSDAAATAHAGVGTVEAGAPANGTPSANGTLSAADAAATAHAGVGTLQPNANSTPSGAPVTISGQVSNGTPGGKVPEGLKVTLMAFNGMSPAFDKSADVAADGSYKFADVQSDANFVYILQTQANGLTFNSDILHASDIQNNQAVLPLKIYETTTDTSTLKVDRLHIFFDFSTAGKVQVVNLYVISNSSDHAIIPTEKTKPVISFELPKGAENLQFQDGALGGRYVQTANGFGDTAAVVPGQGQQQILFAYDMPYDSKLSISVKTPLPTDAAIVMVPPGLTLKGDQLVAQGQRDVQGTSFQMFQALGTLKAGDALNMEVSGSASAGGAAPTGGLNQTTYLLIGLGAFGLVLIGAGSWLFYSRRRQPALAAAAAAGASEGASGLDGASSEMLLDAIMALDDQHASGELGEEAYQERRAELKSRLADALAREKKS